MKRLIVTRLILVIACWMILAPLNVSAQADTSSGAAAPFDPIALAERYRGYTPPPPLPELTPIYEPGDSRTFEIGKVGQSEPTEITAQLVARGQAIYIWVEDGVTASTGNMRSLAGQIQGYYLGLQAAANYEGPVQFPGFDPVPDTNALVPVPDVDSDPHLYVVYTTDLSDDRDGIYNPLDSTPSVVTQYSNEHEIIAVNTTPFANMSLDDGLYASAIARAIYKMVMSENNPTQDAWLADALNWRMLFTAQNTTVSLDTVYAYFAAPETSLIRTAGLTNRTETLGGTQLFLNYLAQRFGTDVIRDLFLASGGVGAVDKALEAHNAEDLITGEQVTMRDVYADFAIANLVNLPLGDGRYVHNGGNFDRQKLAHAQFIPDLTAPVAFPDVSVLPFATRYFSYTAPRAQTVEASLQSPEFQARLPVPTDHDPADRFYWSGQGAGRDATLTRTLDLSGVDSATLTFDAWHDLADGWNYGYVSVSTDDGATWTALPTQTTISGSRYGTTYGSAFAGISNPEKPHPFPIMGVTIGNDGYTVQDVSPGSAAAQAGILPGDAIIGYNGREWQGAPNVIGLLANYAPGDTLNLYIQRRQGKLNMPIVLGAHPTRVVYPPPLWQPQSVDLTSYAGQKILLRFEYISMPLIEDHGFAVDNLAVPEIGWSDSGDDMDSGWTSAGWSSVDNQVSQHLIVQAVMGGTQTKPAHVRRLTDAGQVGIDDSWRFDLDAGETLFIAVSGVNDDTDQPGTFDLSLQMVP